MSKRCEGPGKKTGTRCSRRAKADGTYCTAHALQLEARAGNAALLEPLRRPHGRFLVKPRAMPILVGESTAKALAGLGAKIPEHPTDKRRKSLPLRGLRYLALALEGGGVELVGKWKVD